MQLDLFGATEESAIREAAAPVLSAAGAWVPPETLAFNAALRRGSLGDSLDILNSLKVGVASSVLLASGFTLSSTKNRAELIAGVQMDVFAAARLRLTGSELRAAREAVPVAGVDVVAPVAAAELPVDAESLGELKATAVVAEDQFKAFYDAAQRMNPGDIEAEQYFALSGAMSGAQGALAKALGSLADGGFALHGNTNDGRLVTLNASAQRAGHWQLTRFDAKGEPWGDTQYETKAQGIKDFLQDIDSKTLDSVGGLFAGVQVVRVAVPVLDQVADAPDFPAAAAGAIQDAGLELSYNRRNRIKIAKGWGDIAHLNDALKVKEAVKANVWPKPDYKKLLADGMQPMVAHIVKQVYDSIAIKPVVGRKVLDDAALQSYFAALNRVEAGLMSWATDSDALQQWTAKNAKIAGAMLGRTTALSDLVGNGNKTLLAMVYPEGYKSYIEEVRIAGGNKMLGALQPGYEDIRRAMKAIDGGWPEKREAWEVQGFRVVRDAKVQFEKMHRGDGYILSVNERYVKSFDSLEEVQAGAASIKSFVLFGKRGFVDSFESEDAAIATAKEHSQRQRAQGLSEKGERVDAVEREGVSRRMEGEDVSSEQLMTEFGFKGVNFGNWMKTPSARAEAQLHLNHAFDAFHDLADILGVPPKAMSLGGMLGLAFGAQGGGGTAAAHFVPGLDEINLTRTNGAGFVAHEFGHALDHYFAAQAGLATATEPFLSAHANLSETRTIFQMVDGRQVAAKQPRFTDVRPEIVAAFKVIVGAMDKRQETEDEFQKRQESYGKQADKWLAHSLKNMRADFVGQEAAFDAIGARIVAGDVGDGHVALSSALYVSPIVVEIRDLYKASSGRAYPVARVKDLVSSMQSVAYQNSKADAEVVHVSQQVTSDYTKNAMSLDRKKGGKPYWSTTLEKFARAFDAFVSDELESKKARNSYLSRTGVADLTVPAGGEREAINEAFRGLLGEFKVRETEKGPVLFSKGADGVAVGVGGEVRTMPISQITAEIERLRRQWPGMPKVNVVAGVEDLPFAAQGNADGAYFGGQVYVVAGKIADLKQLQKVMAHECVLHHGLEDMLGDYGFAKLHRGVQKLKAAGDPVVDELAENIRGRYGVLPPEEETKEIVARAGEQCLDDKGEVKISFGFMKGVFAGVASWLRDHGIQVPFSNFELQGIMHNAGEWVKLGRGLEENGQRPGAHAPDNGVVAGAVSSLAENAAVGADLEVASDIVVAGYHYGRVLGVVDGIVLQKTGREDGYLVRHEVARLSGDVVAGDVVEIQYRGGVGLVGTLAAEVGRGR